MNTLPLSVESSSFLWPTNDVNSFGEIPIDFDRPIGTTDQIINSLNIPVDRFFD